MQDYQAAPDLISPASFKSAGEILGATSKKAPGVKPQATTTAAKAAGKVALKQPDSHLTMSEIKQSIVAKCLLPLGSSYLCSRSALHSLLILKLDKRQYEIVSCSHGCNEDYEIWGLLMR